MAYGFVLLTGFGSFSRLGIWGKCFLGIGLGGMPRKLGMVVTGEILREGFSDLRVFARFRHLRIMGRK